MDTDTKTSDHFGSEVASFYLPKDLLARLDHVAIVMGYSRSECVNKAITYFVETVAKMPEFRELARIRVEADRKIKGVNP